MKILLTLLTVFVLPAISFAQETDTKDDAKSKINLSQFSLGKTVSGDEVTIENLKGKPVVLEFWGLN